MVLFNKKLIFLHHDDNTFLFYFDTCIKVTLSAITLTKEKWCHLTWWLNYIIKQLFYDIWHLTSFVMIKKYLGKTCYTIKPFRHSKIKKTHAKRMLKKKDKKIQELSLTEILIFATANTFFQLNLVFIAESHTGFRSGILWKYELRQKQPLELFFKKWYS